MERLDGFADLSIRRACAFVGLAMVTVMVALSFDPMLAFRTGAEIAAMLALGLVFAGWRAPHRDIRHSEVYALLRSTGLPREMLSEEATRARIAAVLRARLFWHAERVGAAALALWVMAVLSWLLG